MRSYSLKRFVITVRPNEGGGSRVDCVDAAPFGMLDGLLHCIAVPAATTETIDHGTSEACSSLARALFISKWHRSKKLPVEPRNGGLKPNVDVKGFLAGSPENQILKQFRAAKISPEGGYSDALELTKAG